MCTEKCIRINYAAIGFCDADIYSLLLVGLLCCSGLCATHAQTYLFCNYITPETVWGYNDIVWSPLVLCLTFLSLYSELISILSIYHWGLQPGWPWLVQNNHSVFAVIYISLRTATRMTIASSKQPFSFCSVSLRTTTRMTIASSKQPFSFSTVNDDNQVWW